MKTPLSSLSRVGLQARIVCCIKFRLIESFQSDRHTDNHAAAMRSSPRNLHVHSRARQRRGSMQIRDATEDDLPGILTIYNHVIATSNAVYTETAATLDDRRAWLAARRAADFPVLVADDAGIVGFASFGDFRPWPGYALTVEHSVYVHEAAHRRGVGTALVGHLI